MRIAIGAPGYLGGRVFTFNTGSALTPSTEYQASSVSGQTSVSGDLFGQTVALQDLDGDITPDLVVGAPGKAVGSTTKAGTISVFETQARAKSIHAATPVANAQLGTSVAIGNFNAGSSSVLPDASADLAAGAPYDTVGTATAAGTFTTWKGPTFPAAARRSQSTHSPL